MSEQPSYDEISRGMWEGVSVGWKKNAEVMEASGHGEVAVRMLDLVGLSPGDRVLELACGPAGVGLRAAEAVGTDGSVLLTDFSPGMVQAARERAGELGVENADFSVADAQDLALEDRSFDAVLCRFGFMLMGDPGAAMRESARVLRPGGRLALAVWGRPEENDWIMIPMRALMEHFGAPEPDLDAPGLWTFRDPDRVRDALQEAGFEDVRVERVGIVESFESVQAAWDYLSEMAGPLQALLGALSDEDREKVQARIAQDARPRTRPDGSLALPGAANVAVATRPGG